MTTSIGKITSFLLLTATLLFGGGEPYRIRMTSSASKARLVGVAGTPTEADTVVGTYTYSLLMHDFPVEHTGNYILQEDPLGGTSYVTRSDWSDSTGKFILGRDAAVGIYGERNGKFFSTSQAAVYNNTLYPLPGVINLEPNVTETLWDSTIWLGSYTTLNIPASHKFVQVNRHMNGDVHNYSPTTLAASEDSFIVVNGGDFYGSADTSLFDITVVSVNATDSTMVVSGIDVVADSLVNWYVLDPGLGANRSVRIVNNDATVGGNTKLYQRNKWAVAPSGAANITPMNEWQPAISMNACKNVWINGVHIKYYPGDGLNLMGQNMWITNSIIDQSYGWFYGSGTTYNKNAVNHNLVGRCALVIGGGTTGNWVADPYSGDYISPTVGVTDTTRNLYFYNVRMRSKGFDCMDIEPLGRDFIENIVFENCEFISDKTAFEILVSDSTIVRNITLKNCYLESKLAAVWISHPGGAITSTGPGYIDNIVFDGCRMIGKGSGYGFYWAGGRIRNITVKNCEIANWSHAWEGNAEMSNVRLENNYIHDNGRSGGIPFVTYTGRCDSFTVKNNRFVNNGRDSTGSQTFFRGLYNSTIENNVLIGTTQNRGLVFEYCDSLVIRNNVSIGHIDNKVWTWDVPSMVNEYNVSGYSSGSSSDSLNADADYTYGNDQPGDTTATMYEETKRVSMNFLGYRDVGNGYIGAKIVSQISAAPGYGGDPWRVQNGHLLFYTTNHFQLTPDATSLRAIITGNGLGLADSSYINFFPKNSASFVDPDTLWRCVGELGYGFRDSSGTIQYKNLGGSWANIGSGSGSGGTGDVVGPALGATADAIALYDGTTGKAIKNSLATISSGGELSVPVVYARPSSPLGFLVSREAILAGTDSCANLGITDGAGALTLYAGNSHNSQITVNNSDVMLFKDAAYYAFQGTAANAIYVSGEKVFAASDSFAALQVSGGCGQLYLVSSDGLPEYATITLKNTDYMEFAGAIKYDFDAEINTLAGTNPGTDTAGDIAIDTDDSRIEFHDGTASRVIPALQCRTFTILEPDVARGKTDDIILFHVMADAFPHGITIKDIALSASAAVSDTHVIEEWSDRAGSSQSTIESITMSSTTYQEDDGTLSDAVIAADAFININLDDSTDDVASLEITITFYVNEGD